MKHYSHIAFCFSFLLIPFFSAAQLQDDFSDGDFTSNPAWSGDAGQFIVNSNKQLQLNSATAGTSYLATPLYLSSLDSIEWQLFIRFSFSPTSTSYGRVYLATDQQDLNGPLNGYYLQLGESGSIDGVQLFKQSGTTSSFICKGVSGRIASPFSIGVKVSRNNSGTWILAIDSTGGTNYQQEATGMDAAFNTCSWFGVSCTYAVSYSKNFYFDNINVSHIVPDVVPPTVLSANATSANHLDVKFSEAVELISAQTLSNYVVNNSIGLPDTALRDNSDLSLVHLTFAQPFVEGLQNQLTVTNVSDLSANVIGAVNSTLFTWYRPQPAEPGDIIINEILFSVNTGGAEFVEIYNKSGKAISLNTVSITKKNLTTLQPGAPVKLTTSNNLIQPDEYLVLTKDVASVKSQYIIKNPFAFLQMSLPDLLTNEDIIVLLNESSQTLDELHYYSTWHFPLLNDVHGISLEKLNPSRPTNDSTSWHSASETAGFATPGYRNSQYSDIQNGSDEVTIEPEVFSPDNDGKDDVANIVFHFNEPGYVANVKVFDSKGRPVRNLIQNILIGNDGAFSWDGINDKKEKARTGIYIFYVQVFDAKGNVKEYKKTCVLATRL